MEAEVEFNRSATLLVLLLLAFAWFLFYGYPTQAPRQEDIVSPPAEAAGDLGSQLLSQAQNPLQNKLPDSVAPVTNPLEGVYKNPFE